MSVSLASGGRTYFEGYCDDVTDIWSPEAVALTAIGHKKSRQFNLRRLLHGDRLSRIAYHRYNRIERPLLPYTTRKPGVEITYYIVARGEAYTTHTVRS